MLTGPSGATRELHCVDADPSSAGYGTLGVPHLHAVPGSLPVLGTTFGVAVDNLPANLAILTVGFSSTASGPLPLPLDLAASACLGASCSPIRW